MKKSLTYDNDTSNMTKGISIASYKTTHDDVKCELYHKLRQENIDARSEIKIKRTKADLVIVKDGYIKCCIEVKTRPGRIKVNGSQHYRYTKLGVPVIYCCGKENISKTVDCVKENFLEDLVVIDQFYYNEFN